MEILDNIERKANKVMQSEDCKDFFAELQLIQKSSNSDLREKILKWLPSVGSDDKDIKKLIKRIKSVDYKEQFACSVDKQVLYALLIILSKENTDKHKSEVLLEKTGASVRIFIAAEIKRLATWLKANTNLPLLERDNLENKKVMLIYRLGVLEGLLSGTQMVHNTTDEPGIYDMIHSFKSARLVNKGRWDIKNKIQNSVTEVAEKQYQEGYQKYHNIMTDLLYHKFLNILSRLENGEKITEEDPIDYAFSNLLNQLKNEYPDLSWTQIREKTPNRQGFMDATRRAARKYNRVHGAWG